MCEDDDREFEEGDVILFGGSKEELGDMAEGCGKLACAVAFIVLCVFAGWAMVTWLFLEG